MLPGAVVHSCPLSLDWFIIESEEQTVALRGGRMKATMQDVALEAGVDKATVSRVLRGDHRISEKTRARVIEAVRSLNYRPDKNARNLSTRKSGLIGVIVSDYTLNWFTSFISGIDRTLSNSEYEVILKRTEGNSLRAAREYGKLTDRSVEGIIWCDPGTCPEMSSAPLVTVGFSRAGAYSVVWKDGSIRPTFETGVLVGRLILNIITGKPLPSRELVIKAAAEADADVGQI